MTDSTPRTLHSNRYNLWKEYTLNAHSTYIHHGALGINGIAKNMIIRKEIGRLGSWIDPIR